MQKAGFVRAGSLLAKVACTGCGIRYFERLSNDNRTASPRAHGRLPVACGQCASRQLVLSAVRLSKRLFSTGHGRPATYIHLVSNRESFEPCPCPRGREHLRRALIAGRKPFEGQPWTSLCDFDPESNRLTGLLGFDPFSSVLITHLLRRLIIEEGQKSVASMFCHRRHFVQKRT